MLSQKNLIIILVVMIVVSLVVILNASQKNTSDFSHFSFDAVFIKNENYILITFEDKSNKSSFAILEILGMEDTFHKEFMINGSFSEKVPINALPKHGWKTIPVTLEITYDKSTIIKMKTEIHDQNTISPEIIFSYG